MDLKTSSEFLKCPKCRTLHGKLFGFDVIVDPTLPPNVFRMIDPKTGIVTEKIVGDLGIDKE